MIAKWLFGALVGLLLIFFGLPLAMLGAIPVMIALGICHSHWHSVPAFGFWAVVFLLWALRVVTPYQSKIEDKSGGK